MIEEPDLGPQEFLWWVDPDAFDRFIRFRLGLHGILHGNLLSG